jgi:hypothetical protein
MRASCRPGRAAASADRRASRRDSIETAVGRPIRCSGLVGDAEAARPAGQNDVPVPNHQSACPAESAFAFSRRYRAHCANVRIRTVRAGSSRRPQATPAFVTSDSLTVASRHAAQIAQQRNRWVALPLSPGEARLRSSRPRTRAARPGRTRGGPARALASGPNPKAPRPRAPRRKSASCLGNRRVLRGRGDAGDGCGSGDERVARQERRRHLAWCSRGVCAADGAGVASSVRFWQPAEVVSPSIRWLLLVAGGCVVIGVLRLARCLPPTQILADCARSQSPGSTVISAGATPPEMREFRAMRDATPRSAGMPTLT